MRLRTWWPRWPRRSRKSSGRGQQRKGLEFAVRGAEGRVRAGWGLALAAREGDSATDLLNNLRVGCKLFWRQVTERSLAREPGMSPAPCPPRRAGLGFHLASTQSPNTRPGGGNPRSRFVNRVPGGGGGKLAEGKAGATAHWLEFGAVNAVPSSFWIWEEGRKITRVTPRLSLWQPD